MVVLAIASSLALLGASASVGAERNRSVASISELENARNAQRAQHEKLEAKHYSLSLYDDSMSSRNHLLDLIEQRFRVRVDDSGMPWHLISLANLADALSMLGNIPLPNPRWDGKILSVQIDPEPSLYLLKDGSPAVAAYNKRDHVIRFSAGAILYSEYALAFTETFLHEYAHAYLTSVVGVPDQSHATWEETQGEIDRKVAQYLERSGYLEASDWHNGELPIEDRPTFSSIDSEEDFADTLALYVVLPDYLRVYFEKRYAWMKQHVFGGIGYANTRYSTREDVRKATQEYAVNLLWCRAHQLPHFCKNEP